jgi:NAD(P)-dependent dehydrogenase (short-subunit alcohol dehydrogenase family)
MSSDHQSIRVALVTGSAQGIGRAIAIRLAADGLDVAIDDLPSKSELLQEVVREIEKLGRKALPLIFDITREEEVDQMVEKTVSELGRLDVVGDVEQFCRPLESFLRSLCPPPQMVANAGISGRVGTIMEGTLDFLILLFLTYMDHPSLQPTSPIGS